MNFKNLFKILIFFIFIQSLFAKSPLLIYYGDNASINYLNHFKVIVLDPDHYNYVFGLKPFKYGYLSIGEVENFREYFKFVKKWNIFIGENPKWKGSYYVDLTNGKWQDFVVRYLIPSILAKGYNGIFLDTVDSLLLNNKEQKVIDFINLIKRKYPKIKLMMNRGIEIADKVNVDAILLESTITSYNFDTKKYYFLSSPHIYKIPKRIKIYSIDYWYLNDVSTIEKIYNIALRLGYKPFVSDISLHRLPEVLYDEDIKNFIMVNPNK